jgi:hypothetical protein
MGDVRYRTHNVVMLELDVPERTTQDLSSLETLSAPMNLRKKSANRRDVQEDIYDERPRTSHGRRMY